MARKRTLAENVHDALLLNDIVKYDVSVRTRNKFKQYFTENNLLVESVAESIDKDCGNFNYYLLIREKK